jgi:hypothetical protein
VGDSGEGLLDNEARIGEHIEEGNAEGAKSREVPVRDAEQARKVESLKLARARDNATS